jgi:hypothetical protein
VEAGRVAAAARNIEAELANEKLEASAQRRLRRRAELIHWLLAPLTIK